MPICFMSLPLRLWLTSLVDDFDCGIMISACHNPYYDNGIKLIDCYGEKTPEETLLLVEDYIDGKLHVFDKGR